MSALNVILQKIAYKETDRHISQTQNNLIIL